MVLITLYDDYPNSNPHALPMFVLIHSTFGGCVLGGYLLH
jgi:hypothetical protein